MPEIVMSQLESCVMWPTDVTDRIQELTESMDNVDVMPDGFSDSEESSENESSVYQPVSKHTQEIIHAEKRLLHTLGLKNGLFERRVPLKVYKNKKTEEKFDQHANVRPQSTGTSSSSVKLERQLSEGKALHKDSSNEKDTPRDIQHYKDKKIPDEKSDNYHKTSHHQHTKVHGKHHHHHNHHHHHHHHHAHTHGKENHDKSAHGKCHNEKGHHDKIHTSNDDIDKESIESDLFDSVFFETILAGQSKDYLNVPVISPTPEVSQLHRGSGAYYARPMSFKFLLAGETLPCNFEYEKTKDATDALLAKQAKDMHPACICSSGNPYDDSFTGWETPQKGIKAKVGRRKKSLKAGSSDITFNRLTQTIGKDPVIFQHYKDNIKYIERYRFYHTVGNVGRPLSYSRYAEKGVESDPYLSRMKSNLTSAMNSHFYGFASHLREQQVGSASSRGSGYEKTRSDDESIEDSSLDARPYSMRDRGKALNLAPVRDCAVPNLRPTDKIDIMQLNKYLNLSTPPVPNNCLQFNFDEIKPKRICNATDMFPTSNVRRGARTLRLGSAEFVKPGTPDSFSKWNSDKRGIQRLSTSVSTSVPGNLIVGSTVSSPVPPQTARARSSGRTSPYVQFQKEHILTPSTPPHHVAGQGFKVCERVSDLSGKERGKFSYTHAANGDKTSPIVRTATAVDFKETYIPRDRSRTITLDVNHLGIRGQQYKQREQIVLYKNRRAQVAKS